MINELRIIEKNVLSLFSDFGSINSLYIDYHPPIVSRIWMQVGELRISVHKIDPCKEGEALFHPHPWKSAVRILLGSYEMGVGHSATLDVPVCDCKLWLTAGSSYEMLEPNGWHYVRPVNRPAYSLMVSGPLTGRAMPLEDEYSEGKKFRSLTELEIHDLISVLTDYCNYYKQ